MADELRHDQSGKSDERRAPDKEQQYEQDELARRRQHSSERPALTRREREERWPIG
jgi:hypothetical protein